MNSMKRPKAHMVDILFTLALFCVFAASSLVVVVIGADVYQKTVADMSANFNSRTSVSYLLEKARQSDSGDSVRVAKVGEHDALVLLLDAAGSRFETWIFCDGFQLKEVLLREGETPTEQDGQAIMEARDLTASELAPGVFRVGVTDQTGRENAVTFTGRSGSGLVR